MAQGQGHRRENNNLLGRPIKDKTILYWAHRVARISCWPSEPATGVRIPMSPYFFIFHQRRVGMRTKFDE